MTTWDQMRKRIAEAATQGDAAAVAACYRPDAVVVAPEGRFEGRDQIEAYWRAQLQPFSDHEMRFVATHDHGDTGVSEFLFSATHTAPIEVPGAESIPPTGKRLSQRGAHAAVMVDGQIIEDRFYYDLAELLGQLGLLPGGGA